MWKLEFEISEFEHLDFENSEFQNSDFENCCVSCCQILQTSWDWAVPSSVEVYVWGLVKALSLIFENDNGEEVWS